MEKIEVVYQPLNGPDGTYHHKYIRYTDANGNVWGARGGPEHGAGLPGFSRAETGYGPSPFGRIVTEWGVFGPDFADYSPTPEPSEIVLTGPDLSDRWKDIKRTTDEIEFEQHTYRPVSQNSNSTVDEILRRSGIPEPRNDGFGEYWSPGSGRDMPPIRDVWSEQDWRPIVDEVFFLVRKAQMFVWPTDPLTLDMDGDGIEAGGIDFANLILFDHDADGIRTASGWIKPDDGFLVLDLNGNGLVDSGRELFGDNTLLANGNKASNGFTALADLDSNGNGRMDAEDVSFGELRLWQDANQDGISQASELRTLTAAGIASISTTASATNIDLGNGNTQPWTGGFTRTNGSSGTSAAASLAGSLLLASNGFYREFTDDPALSPEALALPQMRGSGWARDLREAMSLSSGTAQTLRNSVATFAGATTRDAQMAQLDSVISVWGDTSGRMVHSVYKYGVDDTGSVFHTKDVVTSGDAMIILHPQGMEFTTNQSTIGPVTTVTAEGAEVLRRLNVLEAFYGAKFLSLIPPASGGSTGSSTTGSSGGGVAGPPEYHATLSGTQINLINQAYDALRESVYGALVVQTRLQPYLDAIELVIDDNGISFDTAPMLAALNAHKSGDERNGLIDLIELNRYAQPTLQATGFAGIATLRNWIDGLAASSPLRAELPALGVLLAASTGGSELAEVYLGDAAANILNAGGGNDTIDGGAGNDNLQGGAGDDVIDGGAGNDVIAGEYVNTFHGWYGGAGNDTYLFGRGDGQDMLYDLDGTTGNHDQIVFKAGVAPADVLVTRFNDDLVLKVSGTSDQIQISNYFAGDGAAGWAIEAIRFTDSPATFWGVSDVKLMVLTGTAENDTLTGFASDDVIAGNAGNDTLYGRGGNDTINGGAGDDLVHGDVGSDTLLGGDGDDTLMGGTSSSGNGGNGDDILDGGAGNDILSGEMHNTFHGWFHGGGNDTYLFGRGDGQDMVYDLDDTAGNVDKIVFKAGVAPSDIQVVRSGDNLILKITGTADQIQVSNYFLSDGTSGWAMEEIRFTDAPATVWTVPDVKAMSLAGAPGNDTLTGFSGDDVIAGNAGNDTLYGRGGNDTINGGAGDDLVHGDVGNDTLLGGDGNDTLMGGTSSSGNGGNGDDTLDGGAGNDILSGEMHNTFHGWFHGGGNDTYLFGRGEGQDMVYDLDSTVGNVDTIRFKAGVVPGDVTALRSGDFLVLKINGTTDQVTVRGYFENDGITPWEIERVAFEDGTVWDLAAIKARVLVGSAGNDTITGYGTDDVLAGNDGNDTLDGAAGNDSLDGGTGDDTLLGSAGNDTLLGGAGNDSVQGGTGDDVLDGGAGNDALSGDYHNTFQGWYSGLGNDTYLFGRGDGQDTIYDMDSTAGNVDTLRFKAGVATSDVQAIRSGSNLVIKINGTTDQVTVQNYFANDGVTPWAVERLAFEDGTVWDLAAVKARLLVGGAGNDAITGYATDDVLAGNDGNDTLDGAAGNDSLDGGTGDDTLLGSAGNDTLLAGAGNDSVQGGTGDDVLDGGAGNDTLSGDYHNTFQGWYSGLGNDTYLFGRGDGQDTIYDMDSTAGNVDTLRFKAGVATSDVQAIRSGSNLVIKINGTTDQVTVQNYFANDGVTPWAVERLAFEDGTVWDLAAVKARLLVGGAGNDAITGYATDDVLAGHGGNDTLDGAAGNDSLDGGIGDDTLLGAAGNDTLLGGAGNDSLQGGSGDDTFDGGAGNDTLSGDYHNTFQGWYSGLGSDTYLFGRGDGQDTIHDTDGTAGNVDKVTFKTGVLPTDVQVVRSGNNLVLKIKGSTDQVTWTNHFLNEGGTSWTLEEVRFADSPSAWTPADLRAMSLVGAEGNDSITGFSTADVISGNAGNDTLWGGTGNDTINGDAGADSLLGQDGDDLLNGGADGDVLQGGNGGDTLDGGAGNDILAGGVYDTWNGNFYGSGNDSYLFGRGDGQDTLLDNDGTVGNLDKIVFKAGVAAADVTFVRSGDNLIAKINGTTDQIQVQSFFLNDGTAWQVEEIRFTDDVSTVWTAANVKQMLLTGGTGNDIIYGYSGADTLTGNGGGDTLWGRGGNDTLLGGAGADSLFGEAGDDVLQGQADADSLQGGAGNDTLEGGTGNDSLNGGTYDGYWGTYSGAGADTYLFGRGDGQDTVYDNDSTAGVQDKVKFGSEIAADQLWFRQVGSNLEVSVIGTVDKVTVANWYSGTAWHTEVLELSNGVRLLDSNVQNLVQAMASFSPPAMGQTTLPENYQSSLGGVISANWQ